MLFRKGGVHGLRNGMWLQRITENMDLPCEPIPGVPVVEIVGSERVLIECHKGICEYADDRIGVHVKYGKVYIRGSCLRIKQISKERILISGKILSVELERR